MDPLTHSLVGALAAKTARVDRRRFWIMTALGELPDVDVLFSGLGSWAFWLQHRGITHSILGVVVQAMAMAWLLRRWDLGSYWRRAFHYSLPLAFHVLCDALTGFGVPLFSPFMFREFSANLADGLNLAPLAVTAGCLWWMRRRDADGWRATRWAWAAWGIYFAFLWSGRVYAARLTPEPAITVIPSVANPFHWSAVEADQRSRRYRQYDVNLWSGESRLAFACPMPDGNFAIEASRRAPQVRDFLKETRWPVTRVRHDADGWRVEWGTLAFSQRGRVRGKVEVEVAPSGEIRSARNVFTFWEPDAFPSGGERFPLPAKRGEG